MVKVQVVGYDFQMISAILFDLDETLLDRTTSLVAFLADQYDCFADKLGDVPFDAWSRRFLVLDARGRCHKSIVYAAILSEFGGELELAPALLEDYNQRCSLYAQAFPGMVEMLQRLRSRGLALGIVTNGETVFQTRTIDALGLRDHVDAVLISEAEGLRKPDARLFDRAADRLGVEPSHCLFVGDNPVADILGAFAAGMQTAWFRSGADWPGDLAPMPGVAIGALSQVLGLIGI